MDVNKRSRSELKSYFVKNAIPTQGNFEELIDGALNQKDDGVVKIPGDALSIAAAGDAASQKKVLNFYGNFGDGGPAWVLSLNPRIVPNDPKTAQNGLAIADGDGNTRLFIDRNTGRVGIGITPPGDALDVAGEVRMLSNGNPIRFASAWSGFADSAKNHAEISNDTGSYKTLMIVGNSSAGQGRKVSIWDRLEVNGTFQVAGAGGNAHLVTKDGNVAVGHDAPAEKLHVKGGNLRVDGGEFQSWGPVVLRPDVDASGDSVIQFMRTTAPLGKPVAVESARIDPSGNFGIGTPTPGAKLHVAGDARVEGRIGSPMWKATQIFDRMSGPLPKEAKFDSRGGTLLLFVSGSAFRTGPQGSGLMSFQAFLDGNSIGWMDNFTNETGSHKVFPTTAFVVPGIAAGLHTFRLEIWQGTAVTDPNDRCSVTVLELPF